MAANAGAIDHVLPVVGQTQIDQCLQKGIPDTLFGPATEAHIDGVPLAVSLMHVAPGTADPQHVKHSIEKKPVIARGPRPTAALRRQQRPDQFPLRIRQIPATHDCSSKSSLESEQGRFGNPFCQHGLGEAVKEAYSDLFTITKNPTKSDREKISGKFKSTFNLSDLQAERCANTFLALTELSDLNATSTSPQQQASNDIPLPTNTKEAESSNGRVIGLKYDIAIHLPATKDIEVYNAIFKSLKEHLVD